MGENFGEKRRNSPWKAIVVFWEYDKEPSLALPSYTLWEIGRAGIDNFELDFEQKKSRNLPSCISFWAKEKSHPWMHLVHGWEGRQKRHVTEVLHVFGRRRSPWISSLRIWKGRRDRHVKPMLAFERRDKGCTSASRCSIWVCQVRILLSTAKESMLSFEQIFRRHRQVVSVFWEGRQNRHILVNFLFEKREMVCIYM